MNKLLNKIAALSIGLAMAIGVGVAVGSGNKPEDVEAAAGDVFTLVTDVSDLAVNDKIVIGSGISGSIYCLSTTQNSNNRAATGTFTLSSGSLTATNAVEVITLGKTSNNWTFSCATTTGYLYAASSSNNYLKTQASNNANGQWTISIDSSGNATITAQGSNTRNKLKYNANNGNPIFSCYSTAGTVAVFKETKKTLSSISVTTAPTKTTYYVGDSFDSTGMVVTATYSDSTTADVTSNCTFTPATFSSTGSQNVTVSYTEGGVTRTTTQSVTVNASRTMTGIALHGTIQKDEYYVGDSWDLTGLDIEVSWSSGDPTYVDLDDESIVYECSPSTANSTSLTSFDIEVIYDEFDETFTVEDIVVNPEPSEVTFDFTAIPDFNDWTTTYEEHIVEGTRGDVTFASADKNTQTITTMPVTKGGDITFVAAEGYTLTTVELVCVQWGSKTQTITLHYSTDSGVNYESTGTTSSNFTLTDNDLPSGTNAIKFTFSSSSNQIGIQSLTIGYEVATPKISFDNNETTGSIVVVNGSTNTISVTASNFDSLSANLFSNTPTNTNSAKANLSYSYSGSGKTITVTVSGKAVGSESFTISASGCDNTLTLNVTVQSSTTFDSLTISTASSAVSFNEDDPFAVTDLVVSANYTIGGSPSTTEFSEAEGNLDQLTYTVGGNVMEIGDTLTTTGTLSVVISYTDNVTGTTRSATSYSITVSPYVAHTWTKVTTAPADWRGTYLLVYENETTAHIFNSSLETTDVSSNFVSGTISSNTIAGSKTIDSVAIQIERNVVSGTSYYHIKLANGKYLVGTAKAMNSQATATANNAVTLSAGDDCVVINENIVRYNATSGQDRFRFYASSTTTMANCALYKMDVTSTVTAEANSFGSGFMTNVGGACDESGLTDGITSSIWNAQKTAFNALSVDAQGLIACANGNPSGANYEKAVSLYDYIIGKYSSSVHADFMNRIEAGKISEAVKPNAIIVNQDDIASIIVISTVTLVSVAAVGGYFLLRKRKEF